MGFPFTVLIVLQLLAHEYSLRSGWEKFLTPVDGVSARALRTCQPRKGGTLALALYMKPGDLWQQARDSAGPQWSGYRTADGGSYRYAQARAVSARGRSAGAVLLDNIPTCIPARCVPDLLPVMEVARWLGEEPQVKLRYIAPLERFSPERVADSDPLTPGKEGEYGATVIDANGFTRVQRGVDVSGEAGVTEVMAAALGRVVLVSREGDTKASALDPARNIRTDDFPIGKPDKGFYLSEYGNCVYVAHPDGFTMRYGRLGSIEATIGQGVLPGTRLGTVGKDGWVHLEVRWGDPLRDEESTPVNPWDFFTRTLAYRE